LSKSDLVEQTMRPLADAFGRKRVFDEEWHNVSPTMNGSALAVRGDY